MKDSNHLELVHKQNYLYFEDVESPQGQCIYQSDLIRSTNMSPLGFILKDTESNYEMSFSFLKVAIPSMMCAIVFFM